ncbi:hypothetical protein LO763_12420 [Glycomyces sp. A-F 0318]|uniref:hypothetical protein n=1 Tax=Glycomyces amatae TaxID=2881355 RepID=UPI001E484126|nr:hypothetical protein [Glycomyces amatae]MCD0444424.1 hypothetical protein [Glycomyces amatae]
MVRGISTAITVRRAAAIALAAAAATALSACGTGQVTQTDTKQSAIAGVNIDAGDLALRDLQVEFDSAEGYAAGGDAALRVWIANEGTEAVSLVGVDLVDEDGNADEGLGTVTFVSAAAAEETPSEEAATPSGEATTGDAESSEEAADGTESSEGAEETSTPAGEATSEAPAFEGQTTFDIPIAPSDHKRLDQGVEGSDYLLIEGLGEDLLPGETVSVVFTFSDGTAIPAELPVGQNLEEEERSYYEPEEPAEGH